jgi:hypothetical protein
LPTACPLRFFDLGQDQKIGARRYTLNINAMNEMGAYVGEKRLVCFTSQDGMRLLKMDTSMIARSTKN